MPNVAAASRLAPELDDAVQRQLYLPDTNVLLTRFLSDSGVAEVSDFMPVEDAGVAHNVVRRAKTVRGEIRFAMRCDPRFDYARGTHTAERRSDTEILFVGRSGARELALRLRASVPMQVAAGAAVAEFTLGADSSAWFVLEVVIANEPSPSARPDYVCRCVQGNRELLASLDRAQHLQEPLARGGESFRARAEAAHVQRTRVDRGRPHVRVARDDRRRTQLGLPLLVDPRLVVHPLWAHAARLHGRGSGVHAWMMARCQELEPGGSLQIMYAIDGRPVLPEETLDHLEGYMGSRPVRIGNDAHAHLQLDIYGELMDSVYLYDKYGSPIGHDTWMNVSGLVDWVCNHWQEKDESIWEVRGGRREFLYSRVMCWVAIDRALRLANRRSFPAPFSRWYEARDSIYRDIFERFWDPARCGFVQHPARRRSMPQRS